MPATHQSEARADFERARRGALLHGLIDAVARRPKGLLPFHEARQDLAIDGESYRGTRAVPVERIVGSLDRADDYDRAFRPRRRNAAARWQRVAQAHHEGKELPAVRLFQMGDAYFVADGHHRVSVARALGRGFLDAEVTEVRVRPARPAPIPTAARSERTQLVEPWASLGFGVCPA